MAINSFTIVMIVQFIAVALICFDLLYVADQKASELQSPIILLLASTLIMFIGYILEIYGTCLEESLLGTAVAYIGKPYVMFFSFIFICRFYGRKVPKAFYYIAACFCSIFFLLVATNEKHHLYYATEEFDISQYYSPLILTRGPLYYLYILACVIFFIGCALIVMDGYKKATTKEAKQQGIYIILMIVSGIVGYAVYLSGVTNGYDSTMMGVFFGTVFLSLLFFRYKIFDVLSIAKDQALRDSPTGFIVMDSSGTVIYSGVKGGYGNCIMIDHGGGIVTLYGHCSSLVASNGQKVSKGQVIAKVGSTGQSTGNHCHFEVRVNGSTTNPTAYV